MGPVPQALSASERPGYATAAVQLLYSSLICALNRRIWGALRTGKTVSARPRCLAHFDHRADGSTLQ